MVCGAPNGSPVLYGSLFFRLSFSEDGLQNSLHDVCNSHAPMGRRKPVRVRCTAAEPAPTRPPDSFRAFEPHRPQLEGWMKSCKLVQHNKFGAHS